MTTQTRYSLYVLGSGFLAAVALILTEIAIRFYGIAPPLVATLGNLAGGIFLVSASAQNRTKQPIVWQRQMWATVVVGAVCIYTLGYLAAFNAIGLIGAGKMALLGQLETVFILTLAILFLGERLSVRRSMAGVFTLAGALVINFDPQALQLTLSWGEVLAVLAPLSVAAGVIVLKPLLDIADARWVTGFAFLFGFLFMAPLIPFTNSRSELGWAALVVIAIMGMTRGWAWLAYNVSLRHIGVSRSAIIFLSFAFFTVVLQAIVARLGPTLGLRLPTNLLVAMIGGGLVAIGIIILQTDPAQS